jgi:hypothetical protein
MTFSFYWRFLLYYAIIKSMIYGIVFGIILFFIIIALLVKNSDTIFHKPSNDEIGASGENYVASMLNEICEDSVIFKEEDK